jgi:hypothetical protein
MIRDLCIIHSYESQMAHLAQVAQMQIFWVYGVICHPKIESII